MKTDAAAARQRRHRARERLGIRVVEIEVGPEIIDRMIDAGALGMREIEDRAALARVLVDLAMQAVERADVVRKPGAARENIGARIVARHRG